MARPAKQSEQRRQHRLPSVRVTADELAMFRERVRQAGISSTDYQRQAALAAKVSSPSSSATTITRRADPALIAELNRIGVNLNQMTRTANGTGRVPPELSRVCEKIEALVMRAVELEQL